FSPDYSLLYVADTGARETKVWDVAGAALRNGRQFVRLEQPGGGPSSADGIRCDADGNIWAGAAPGVQVIAPDGTPIGVIRLPEICANVAFGGARRNRLFMTASQSPYSAYVGVAGAHICQQGKGSAARPLGACAGFSTVGLSLHVSLRALRSARRRAEGPRPARRRAPAGRRSGSARCREDPGRTCSPHACPSMPTGRRGTCRRPTSRP